MTPRPLRIEQALDLLPEVDDLAPLRDALIGASGREGGLAWASSELHSTLDTRLASADALEAELPALLDGARARLEGVYRGVLASLRAMESGDSAGAARALVAAGEVEEAAGRREAAERYYARAAELGRKPRDRRAEGLAMRRLARVARSRGELDRAAELYLRGHEIAEAQHDRDGVVVACQGLGNVLADRGAHAEAAHWYARGLEMLAEEPPTRLRWQLESNLSVMARRAGRLEECERWLERARETVEALHDEAGRVYLSNAEGQLWVARDIPERAELSYRRALALARSPGETAPVLVNLAEALLLQRRTREAEAVLRDLERLALAHRLIASLAHAYRGLGAAALARRDEEGFLFFEQALDLGRMEGLPPFEQALTQREYAAFEAAFGNLDSARARFAEARRIFAEVGAEEEAERAAADLLALDIDPHQETRP